MPNIIINNYCNQKCSYCFANENMKNKKLQKDMNILTYIKILKFLKTNQETEVRLL
jgi:sulfatase maturation enzyme AslB (radical SAM superfamily)